MGLENSMRQIILTCCVLSNICTFMNDQAPKQIGKSEWDIDGVDNRGDMGRSVGTI